MNRISLGLSKSPSSGQLAYSSASNCNIKLLNSLGRSCKSISRKMLTTPRPSSAMRIKSSTSKLFSPKNTSAPCCSNSTTLRKMVPVLVVLILPYSFSRSALPPSALHCSSFLKSFRSSRGKRCSSAYLNSMATIPCWVSLRPNILLSKMGPNSVTVAFSCTPFWLWLRVSSSAGKPVGT